MKQRIVIIFALLLSLSLCACQPRDAGNSAPPSDEQWTTAPVTSATPPLETPDPASSGAPVSLQPAPPEEPDNARYFFVQGCFLGAWDDGTWRGADQGGFTVGQLFNRDYVNWFGETAGAVRFYVADGPGAFDNPAETRRLLEPFGVVEGENFIMKLPGALTGGAAALEVPDYGFYAWFDGQSYYLISNAHVTTADLNMEYSSADLSAVFSVLREASVKFDEERVSWEVLYCDVDGDGAGEQLTLIRSVGSDDGEILIHEGDDIFYALLVTDGDQTSLVSLERIDYTENIVAHFSPGQPIVSDLDGDGVCEIILQHRAWEWGHYSAFALENGQWTEVLRAEYGT